MKHRSFNIGFLSSISYSNLNSLFLPILWRRLHYITSITCISFSIFLSWFICECMACHTLKAIHSNGIKGTCRNTELHCTITSSCLKYKHKYENLNNFSSGFCTEYAIGVSKCYILRIL